MKTYADLKHCYEVQIEEVPTVAGRFSPVLPGVSFVDHLQIFVLQEVGHFRLPAGTYILFFPKASKYFEKISNRDQPVQP